MSNKKLLREININGRKYIFFLTIGGIDLDSYDSNGVKFDIIPKEDFNIIITHCNELSSQLEKEKNE